MKDYIKLNSKFKESIEDTVYTKFENGGKEKELKDKFKFHDIEYSRELVKQIIYLPYQSRGGWRTFEEYTDWIFQD